VVTSDGWGFDEYVTHERNGLVVKGRYGKASWADAEAGMLREDYEYMFTSDPRVVEGLVEAVSRLVEDRELRQRLGRAARREVETKFTPEHWNQGLKRVLDHARSPGQKPGPVVGQDSNSAQVGQDWNPAPRQEELPATSEDSSPAQGAGTF
jgi:hypothetical protein